MRTQSVCQFVTASSIREDIVRLLSQQPQPTPTLIGKLDACRSGVYKELSNLSERGALTEAEDGWELTACGQLVTDTIERREATEAFLGRDLKYWQHHDLNLLPDRFRQRLPEIGEYEIVRGGMPAVNEHVSELVSRVEASEHCDVVTPVFLQGLEDTIPDSPKTRVLVTRPVLDRILYSGDGGQRTLSSAEVRILSAEFGLSCTGDSLCLVFPNRADGDWKATFVSETDDAVAWGEGLFDSLWADADPAEEYHTDSKTLSGRRGMVGKPLERNDSTWSTY